jgi:hypothetical protein
MTCGKTDHVADGVDVVDLGLELFVDEDSSSAVGVQPGIDKVQMVGLALPPRRIHHSLGGDLLAAGQRGEGARGADVDRGDLLAKAERDRQLAQVKLKGFDDLGIAEVQHGALLFDDGDLCAQSGEYRRVLDADHAGADDDHRRGNDFQVENAVGVQHSLFVERDAGRVCRLRAGGDHDVLSAH